VEQHILFFFLIPIWLLVVLTGIVLLFFKRTRLLSAYLLVASTSGLIVSFVLSFAVLMLVAWMLAGTSMAWIALVAHLFAIFVGGVIGFGLGAAVVYKTNKLLRSRRQKVNGGSLQTS
jgi:hypothetical protein